MSGVLLAMAFIAVGVAGLFRARRGPAPAAAAVHPTTMRRVLRWRDLVEEAIKDRAPVRVDTILGIIAQESQGRPDVVGQDNDIGLMQVVPRFALADFNAANDSEITPNQLKSPDVNISVGSWYYWQRLEEFGNVFDALRAYNKGPTGARVNDEAGAKYADSVILKTREISAEL